MTLRRPFQTINKFGQNMPMEVELFELHVRNKFREVEADLAATTTAATATTVVDDRIIAKLAFSLTAGTSSDVRIYKVPRAAPGKHGTFVLSRAIVWLTQRLDKLDAGNVNVRIGSTLTLNDIMTDQNVVAATTLSIIGGLSIASLGTSMLAANGYEMALDPGNEVWMRCSTAGAISQGEVTAELFGYFQP